MSRIRPHLTYANVMSTIAVFSVLAGGSAWAASKIGTKDIKDGAVTTAKLHDAAVRTAKIHDDSVGSKKLKDGSVSTAKIQSDAVTGAKVNESSLGTVPKADIGLSPVAYALVNANGTVDSAHSRGLSNTNLVANPPGSDAGTYCIRGVTGVKSAIVVADTAGGNHHATIKLGGTPCPGVSGVQFSVATFGLDAPGDDAFFIWFFN